MKVRVSNDLEAFSREALLDRIYYISEVSDMTHMRQKFLFLVPPSPSIQRNFTSSVSYNMEFTPVSRFH
jgi:hypothetical protein